jgi:hypothetical protein
VRGGVCDLQSGLDISEQNKYILKIATGNRAHRRPPVEAPARDDPFVKILGGAGCGLRGGPRYGKLEVMSRASGLLEGAEGMVFVPIMPKKAAPADVTLGRKLEAWCKTRDAKMLVCRRGR